jgi:hypothetical protein
VSQVLAQLARNPDRLGGLTCLDAAADPTLTEADYEALPVEIAHLPARVGKPDPVPFPEAETRQPPIDPAVRRAIVEDNRVKPEYMRIRVPVVAVYRTVTMEQALKEYPPQNERERDSLNQGLIAPAAPC